MRQSRDAVATSSRLCESALPTRSRVTAIRSDDARPWISFRQAPGVFGAGRAISKKKQPRSSGSTRAAASRVDARWRSNARCARTARDTPSVSASSATKAAPPLTSIFSARTSPAGAPRVLSEPPSSSGARLRSAAAMSRRSRASFCRPWPRFSLAPASSSASRIFP